MGYGLAVEEESVILNSPPPTNSDGTQDLTQLTLGDFPEDALFDGIRIRPEYVRFAFNSSGTLNPSVSPDIDVQNDLFVRLNRPQNVSFLYTILDSGTGRELQNQPIHNVAGLGIANGKRPFKQLARPMVFLPRSTVRVSVTEDFGRGELYIVFQGFKILSAGLRPGAY